MNPTTIQILYTLEDTLLFSIVTIGVFVSFRLLKFPDLTAEGGVGLSAVVGGLVALRSGSPVLGLLACVATGSLAGVVTAVLANFTRLPTILASILTMTICMSVGLLIAGQPSLRLPDIWVFDQFTQFITSHVVLGLVSGVLILAFIVAGLLVLYRTGMGFLLRTRGENPQLARELNRSLLVWDLIGLGLANGIVGLAAALISQRAGYASIKMGNGMAISALAAILLGEALFFNRTLLQALVGCVLGTLILRLVRLLALNLGMPDGSLDLVTSSLVIVFYYVAKGRTLDTRGPLENIRL